MLQRGVEFQIQGVSCVFSHSFAETLNDGPVPLFQVVFVGGRTYLSCGGRRREYWRVWWLDELDEGWQSRVVRSKSCCPNYEGEEAKIPRPVVADVVSEGNVPAFFHQPFVVPP